MSKLKLIILFCVFYSVKANCPFSSVSDPDVADPETTTPNGCKCASLCGATVEDGFTVRINYELIMKFL